MKFEHMLVYKLKTQRYLLDSLFGLPGRDGGHFLVNYTKIQAGIFGRELKSNELL